MKIEFEKPRHVIRFSDLDIGTVFRNPKTESIHIKTERFF